MKRTIQIVFSVLAIIITACSMGQTPPPEVATQPPATEPQATESPATEAPAGDATPELVAIDLAGPPMEVGSKHVYIDGSVLVAVPGGPFVMGYSYADNPERDVTVGDFWIYSTEVTNQQYALCVNAGKCTPPDLEDNPEFTNYRFVSNPVVGVNHTQAAEYCTFVHGRLPTEAEWEKAARGPEGNIFPWGDNSPVCDLLNYNFCKGKKVDIRSYPDGVSYYGLFDMSGNIREWVADWYKNDYFKDSEDTDPLGPELGQKRSVRSSSFADSADFAISAHRFSLVPEESLPDLGFRCVVGDPTFFAPLCTQLAFIGTGPGGGEAECQPDIYCNDVDVSLGQLPCSPGDPSAFSIVTFSVDPAPYDGLTELTAPGCTDLGTGMKFQCESGVAGSPAKIAGQCYDTASCDPVCPMHYMLVGDSCVWDGSGTAGTECIEGTTYDPVNQCCSATPGSAVDFTVCPDGQHLFGGICVADPTGIIDSAQIPINYDSCNPGNDPECDPDNPDPIKFPNGCGDPGGCQNPPTCNYPYTLGQDGCSCVCLYSGC
jgi:formylglycine-generating enzyme required for sulfatase activity